MTLSTHNTQTSDNAKAHVMEWSNMPLGGTFYAEGTPIFHTKIFRANQFDIYMSYSEL